MNIFIGITVIIVIIISSFVTLIFIAITGTEIMKINLKEHNILNELNFWVRIPDLREQIINIYIQNNKTEEEGKKDSTLILRLIGLLIIYLLIGFTGVLFWIYNILNILYLLINTEVEPNKLSFLIALQLMMLFIWFLFYIDPLSLYLGLDKFRNKIDRTLSLFFEFINKFINRISYIIGEVIGSVIFICYVMLIKKSYYLYLYNYVSTINPLVWYTLLILIYQYFFSKFISKLIHIFYIKEYKNANLIFSNKLYSNSNFFSMIILILFCYMLDNSDQVLINSLTVVFLIDTYFINRKNILKYYKK